MVLGTSRANNNLIIKSQDFKLDIGKRLLLWNSDMMKIMLYPLSGRFESFFKLSQISNSFPVYLLEIIRIKLDMCCSNLCCSRVSCTLICVFPNSWLCSFVFLEMVVQCCCALPFVMVSSPLGSILAQHEGFVVRQTWIPLALSGGVLSKLQDSCEPSFLLIKCNCYTYTQDCWEEI